MKSLLVFLLILLIVWFYAAIRNFNHAEKNIQRYLQTRENLVKTEGSTQNMREKTEAFTERIRMQTDYPELHESAMSYMHNKETFRKNLRNKYLRYGFVYNLWRI